MEESIEQFVYLSRMFGGLDELVQAGGGNISVKDYSTNSLVIKASGCCLADVSKNNGFVVLDLKKSLESIEGGNEFNTNELIKHENNKQWASIETYFHIFLKKYVVHLHPNGINKYMCNNSVIDIKGSITIDYYKPGYLLSEAIRAKYAGENIIFLKSHGVIFTHDTFAGMIDLVVGTIDELNKDTQMIEYMEIKRKMERPLNILIRTEINPSIFATDVIRPLTPDIVVYLGRVIGNTNNSVKDANILIRHKSNLYIQAENKYKCHQILEVLKSYAVLYNCSIELSRDDADEIQSWPAEIYRKTI